MNHKRYLCLALAGLMFMLCASCGMYGSDALDPKSPQESEKIPQTEELPVVDAIPAPEEEPAPEKEPVPEAEEPAATEEPAPTEEPVPAVRPGTYTGEDGSVLKVSKDGSCSYETAVDLVVSGQNVKETVKFHGAVNDSGVIAFTKVTYRGMDITSMAAKAGYDDASRWEAAANELYNR